MQTFWHKDKIRAYLFETEIDTSSCFSPFVYQLMKNKGLKISCYSPFNETCEQEENICFSHRKKIILIPSLFKYIIVYKTLLTDSMCRYVHTSTRLVAITSHSTVQAIQSKSWDGVGSEEALHTYTYNTAS